jgi:cobalt/nickel transport system ATP-binding protein
VTPQHLGASGLSVDFGARNVLRSVDLRIPNGERLALLGANGSGKTTLLRTLAGAVRPCGGAVVVDGQALVYTRAGLRAHRQSVQLVTQDPDDQLFAADVYRDVSFGPLNLGLAEPVVRRRVSHALATLSLEDLAERPIHELSYGQRKRVAIAGALAMEPAVILLDEPTAGLDPQGVDEMVAALEGLVSEGATVVVSTHDVDFALWWADTVAVLVDGCLTHGSPDRILGDADLIEVARLRRPLVTQLATELGLANAGLRDVPTLVTAILRSPNVRAGALFARGTN